MIKYLSRIKYYVLLAVIIFIISIICGNIFHNSISDIILPLLQNIINSGPAEETGLSFFSNNITVMILLFIGGILFSISSVVILVLNGLVIGYVSTLSTISEFILLTLPHGIFELTAIILACSAGFMLTMIIFKLIHGLISKKITFHEKWLESKVIINDIILTIILVIFLTLIAGFIEAYITVPFAMLFI